MVSATPDRQPTVEPKEVRLAVGADVPRLREIVEAAYGKYVERMGRPPSPMLQDIGQRVDARHVWVTGEPPVGLLCLAVTDGAIVVENAAVHPAAQGTGLGRLLMEFAEEEARRHGYVRLWFATNEVMTENQAFYRHLGYREFNRHQEDGYRRVFMEKILGT
jgi:GNAT superfamily N-acetyltransferase